MTRIYDTAAWLFTSLGVALLVCSVALVPIGRATADDGGGGDDPWACMGEPTCAQNPRQCYSQLPPTCYLIGVACKNTPSDQCGGCSCQWHQPANDCVCKSTF